MAARISSRRPALAWLAQAARFGMLCAILWSIHLHARRSQAVARTEGLNNVALNELRRLFPNAERLGEVESSGTRQVLDAEGRPVGTVLQTFPEAEEFLGFSGPTNLLVGLDEQQRVVGMEVLFTRDTQDHVDLIRKNERFLQALNGLKVTEAAEQEVDAVAGATLTSLAIVQGLRARLGERALPGRFGAPLDLKLAREFFPEAESLVQEEQIPELWRVTDAQQQWLGHLLSNSPAADQRIGYQGPTRAVLGLDREGKVIGLRVEESYDNDPYVGYVRDDYWFRDLYQGESIEELASHSWEELGIEGVSGATMTSQAVAQGLLEAARRVHSLQREQKHQQARQAEIRLQTLGTAIVLAFGVMLSFSRWRSSPWIRRPFQIVLLVYLGLINGDLLSSAMAVGWAENGIPWQNALGLVLLSLAAVLLPLLAKQNVYCDHICPHGAAQQLLPRRWRWQRHPAWLRPVLQWLRPALLVVIVAMALGRLDGQLVDLEPFDAYSWRAAAWPTITVAVVGLGISLFLPMGYCRYGCPTGAVLGYLRRSSRSDRFHRGDAVALLLLGLSWVLL